MISPQSRLRYFHPTTRAILWTVALLALLLGPALQQADIVALMISTVGLGIILITGLMVLVTQLIIKRKLECTVAPPVHTPTPTTAQPLTFLFSLSSLSVVPPLELTVQAAFDRHGLLGQLHVLRGRYRAGTTFSESIKVPHRGLWGVNKILCSCVDRFGLWRSQWQVMPLDVSRTGAPKAIMVAPAPEFIPDLPVICSAEREGDLVTSTQSQQGDLFDLKPYHPSDGTRRVVWKIFARSGELVARKPEAAITPEGHIALLCLATGHDDKLAAQSIAYAERLESLGLSILGGALGMGSSPLATSAASFGDLLISVVEGHKPEQPQLEPNEFVAFVTLAQNNTPIRLIRVACLVSSRTPEAVIIAAGQALQSQGIEPVFMAPEGAAGPIVTAMNQTRPSRLAAMFFAVPVETGQAPTEAYRSRPSETCAQRGWTIV